MRATTSAKGGLSTDGAISKKRKKTVPQFLVYFYRNRELPNFAIRQFVTTEKFGIENTEKKNFFDQLETFGANFTHQISFLISQNNG